MTYKKKKYLKKQLLCLIINLFIFGSLQGQFKVFLSAKTGYAFNPFIEINGEEIINSRGIDFDMESSLRIQLFKRIYGEVGVAGRFIFASGKINNHPFNAQTLRFLSPLRLGIQIANKWDTSIGITFQNNVDFKGISSKINFYWRNNFTLSGRYHYNNKWYFIGELSYSVRNIPDIYFINDPKVIIFLGLARTF